MGQQMWGGKRDWSYLGKKLALPGLFLVIIIVSYFTPVICQTLEQMIYRNYIESSQQSHKVETLTLFCE